MSGRFYGGRRSWYRGGRYYGRNRGYRRSNSSRKAWGNMRAAKQQADQSTVTINIPSNISAFSSSRTIIDGKAPESLGCFALSIFNELRKSEFFNNYGNMYDEFKIDRIRVKLLPTSWSNVQGQNQYRNLTVYTAWDRSGLNETQYEIVSGRDYRTSNNIPGEFDGQNVWVIGSANGTEYNVEIGGETVSRTDYGGLYVTVGKDITTYSSAESRVVNINSNTSIVRWLNPKTMQEKGQWISTASLKPWYLSYDRVRGRYYDLPVTDIKQLRVEDQYEAVQTVSDLGFGSNQISRAAISGLSSDNPCSLLEDNGIRFKPILLVSVYPEDNNTVEWENPSTEEQIVVPANLMQFNIETEVVVSFRGLRKSKVVAA